MRGLELGLLLLFLHFARHVLEGVLDVLGERAQRFIVADFARVGGLEGLVVLHERWGLLAGLTGRVFSVFADNRTIGVEKLRLLHFLRERFLLHEGLSGFALCVGEHFRSVEIVLHVINFSTKSRIFANFTHLGWVSLDVPRLDYDFAIFLVTEVLLNLLVVLHVLVG